MKKIVCVIICISLSLCLVSCKNEELLTLENAENKIKTSISFGEVSVMSNVKKTATNNKDYYLECMATIRVFPTADYSFNNVSIVCGVYNARISKVSYYCGTKIDTSLDTKYKSMFGYPSPLWYGEIQLDKNGYGECTLYLYLYSDDCFENHPSREAWNIKIFDVKGTVV